MRKLFFRCFSKSPAYAKKAEDDPDTQQRLLGQLYGVMDVNPQRPKERERERSLPLLPQSKAKQKNHFGSSAALCLVGDVPSFGAEGVGASLVDLLVGRGAKRFLPSGA